MPRNTSGVYSLPVAAFSAGSTIKSADVNSDMSDIASALTDSLSVSGKGGMSAALQAYGGSLANPGYCFASDSATGMWLSGSHQLQFANNGAVSLTLSSDVSAAFAGNVSIAGSLSVSGGISGGLPAGVYVPWGGSSAPSGWLLCYGQAISRTTYAALFANISTLWGAGDGSTTFNVPDLRGRIPVGLDNMGGSDAGRIDWSNTIGTAGGEQYHTLITNEIPSHNHGVNDPGHSHIVSTTSLAAGPGSGPVVSGPTNTYTTNAAATGISIRNAGGDAKHNNMQPGFVSNWIIKT